MNVALTECCWAKREHSPPPSPPPFTMSPLNHLPSPSPSASSLFTSPSPSHPPLWFIPFQHLHPTFLRWPRPSTPRLSIIADRHIFTLSPPPLTSPLASPCPAPCPHASSPTMADGLKQRTRNQRWEMRDAEEKTSRGGKSELRGGKLENVKSEWQGKSYKLVG